MSSLAIVLSELTRLGYDAGRVYTFPDTNAAGDKHHVYFVGRPNDRHDVIVRETPDGNCRFYLPLRVGNDSVSQATGLAQWLKQNAEPVIRNELTIRGDHANLERLLPRVEALLRNGWKRDREVEARRSQNDVRSSWDYCFSCTATPDRPAAAFWVHARNSNELYVSKVVPLGKEELDKQEEERLLAEFRRDFLDPAAAEVGVKSELAQHQQTVEDVLSHEAVQLLRNFSSTANRYRLHPNDLRRWSEFLIRVHEEEALFDSTLLEKWLRHENWPVDTRRQLMSEYEIARSLLSVYDEEVERR